METHLKSIEALLEKVKPFPTVGNRIKLNQNKTKNGNSKRLNCIHFGVKKIGNTYSQTKASKLQLYPELENEIHKFIEIYYPDLDFNQILINKNNWFSMHKDKNNKIDEALLIGLGDYIGGEVNLHDDEGNITSSINLKYNPILFANKTTNHSVNKWLGNRYSIITYLI